MEGALSRTAARAWQWTSIPVGSESGLAAGVARVLLEERLVAARGPMPSLTLAEAAAQTGLSTEGLRNLARTIASHAPAVAIASDDNPAVAALNVVLGAVGARGGIVRRSKRIQPYISAMRSSLLRVHCCWMPACRGTLCHRQMPKSFGLQLGMEDRVRQTGCFLPPGFLRKPTIFPARRPPRSKPMRCRRH